MNDILQTFARYWLKTSLAQLPASNRDLFKRMYSATPDIATPDEVVDKLDEDQLDWAMQQVQRSLVINKSLGNPFDNSKD